MTPDKQQLFDMTVSGGAGVATGILHDIYVGRKITIKKIIIKGALSAVVFIGLRYLMDALHVQPDQQAAIAFFVGAIGPEIVVAFMSRKKQIIEKGLDVIEERVKA